MSLARRLKKLEDRRRPPPSRVPHVLDTDTLRNETRAEARERFAKRWGPIPAGHNFLVVPQQPQTDEDDVEVQRWIERQQAELMEFVKRRSEPAQLEEPAI